VPNVYNCSFSLRQETYRRLYRYGQLLVDKNAMFLFIALPELLIVNSYNHANRLQTYHNILTGTAINVLALLFFNVLNSHSNEQIQANIVNQDIRPKTDRIDVLVVGVLYYLFATRFLFQNIFYVSLLVATVYLYFEYFAKIFICKDLFAGFVALYLHIHNIGFYSREKYRLVFDKNHVLFQNCLTYSGLISIQDIPDIRGDRIEGRKTGIILAEDYFGELRGNIIFRTGLASLILLYSCTLGTQAIEHFYDHSTFSASLFCMEIGVNMYCAIYLYLSAYLPAVPANPRVFNKLTDIYFVVEV